MIRIIHATPATLNGKISKRLTQLKDNAHRCEWFTIKLDQSLSKLGTIVTSRITTFDQRYNERCNYKIPFSFSGAFFVFVPIRLLEISSCKDKDNVYHLVSLTRILLEKHSRSLERFIHNFWSKRLSLYISTLDWDIEISWEGIDGTNVFGLLLPLFHEYFVTLLVCHALFFNYY